MSGRLTAHDVRPPLIQMGSATLEDGQATISASLGQSSVIHITHKSPRGTLGSAFDTSGRTTTNFLLRSLNPDRSLASRDQSTVGWIVVG